MELIDSLKALADESRLRLLNLLSRGHFNVQEITSILGSSQSTVSHHLKVLQNIGIAKSHREGTWIYYTLDTSAENSVAQKISQVILEISASDQDKELRALIGRDNRSITAVLDKRRDRSRMFFEANAAKWDEIRKGMPDDEALMAAVLEQIPAEATLLELGCGSGALFEKALPRTGKSIGVDNSQAMLDEAFQRLSRHRPQLDLRLGNLEHLPVGDCSIDCIAAYMVMHHIAKPIEALKEAYRVAKPGGSLIVADLCSHSNEFMRERYSDLWLGFDVDEFEGWAQDCGFKDIKSKTFGEDLKVFLLTCIKPEQR
ncbi:MAG: metalloregulator ArsR/SmtB family transcription factor [Deltaproteobacteria bacterium]|nr:metalloregulator ArsR/SmtB family transcription factor [Deltaproteobacteria bacterium]